MFYLKNSSFLFKLIIAKFTTRKFNAQIGTHFLQEKKLY